MQGWTAAIAAVMPECRKRTGRRRSVCGKAGDEKTDVGPKTSLSFGELITGARKEDGNREQTQQERWEGNGDGTGSSNGWRK